MREPDWIDLYLGPASVAFQLGVGMACLAVGGIVLGLKINAFADSITGIGRIGLHIARFAWGLFLAAILSFAWLYELVSVRVPWWQFAFLLIGAALATTVLIRAGVFKEVPLRGSPNPSLHPKCNSWLRQLSPSGELKR